MASGDISAALFAFTMAAFTMTVLFFLLATGIALAQEQLVSTLRAHTLRVKHWGGYILILVGIWLISLTVFVDFFARLFPV